MRDAGFQGLSPPKQVGGIEASGNWVPSTRLLGVGNQLLVNGFAAGSVNQHMNSVGGTS